MMRNRIIIVLFIVLMASTAAYSDDFKPTANTFSPAFGYDGRGIGSEYNAHIVYGGVRTRTSLFTPYLQLWGELNLGGPVAGPSDPLSEYNRLKLTVDFAGGIGASIDIGKSLNLFIGIGFDFMSLFGLGYDPQLVFGYHLDLGGVALVNISWFFADGIGLTAGFEPMITLGSLMSGFDRSHWGFSMKSDLGVIFRY